MRRLVEIFLIALLIAGLSSIAVKKIFFKTIDWTFVFEDPDNAHHVKEIAVVGDFSHWQKQYYMRPVGEGKWALSIPLSPGNHLYRFVINNQRWIKDPKVKDYAGPYSNSKIFVDELPLPVLVGSQPPNGSWLYRQPDSLLLRFDAPVKSFAQHFRIEIQLDSVLQTYRAQNNTIGLKWQALSEGEHRCLVRWYKKSDQSLIHEKQLVFFVNRQNQPPLADAGFTKIVFLDQPVTLNGSLSYDPDFEPLVRFSWRQAGGPAVQLSGANTPFASLRPVKPGHYRFRLSVSDSMGLSARDEVDVWALPARKRKVQFTFKPDSAIRVQKVSLVGEFNNWQAGKNEMQWDSLAGLWKTAIDLPPGNWEYKFVLNDASWIPDPRNPQKVADGWQGFNSIKQVAPNPFLEGRFVQNPATGGNELTLLFVPDSQSAKTKFHWFADVNNPQPALPEISRNRLRFNLNWPSGHYYYYLVLEKDGRWSEPQTLLINHFTQTQWMDFRQTPAWADTSIFYEVYVRRFSKSGDLQGLIKQLPYLKTLGVQVLWLMPVYEGPTEHGYAPTSLFNIEKDYGTLEDYQAFIEQAHELGFRVIFDFVANHLSDQHRFVKAAAENPASPLRSWFYWKADGTWGYHNDWDTLVNLNYNTPMVRHHILNAALFWLNLGVDGFRCDVAWAVPHDFWKQFRRVIKQVNPQCLLLNEVLPRQRAFHEFEFDMSYDTDFYGNVLDVLHGRKPLSAIVRGLEKSRSNYPRFAQALRYLENHDLPRFNTQFDIRTVKAMTQLLWLLPGSPLVYYGQEYFADQMRPWFFELKNKKWFDFFQKGIKLRQASEALKRGDLKSKGLDDRKGIWIFERQSAHDSLKVIVNFSKTLREVKIERKTTK